MDLRDLAFEQLDVIDNSVVLLFEVLVVLCILLLVLLLDEVLYDLGEAVPSIDDHVVFFLLADNNELREVLLVLKVIKSEVNLSFVN